MNEINNTGALNRIFLQSHNALTNEEKEIALSIFDKYDNASESSDTSSEKGIISGNALKEFYYELRKKSMSAVGKLATLFTPHEKDILVEEIIHPETEGYNEHWTRTGIEHTGDLGKYQVYERIEGDKKIQTHVYHSTTDENQDGIFDERDSVQSERIVIQEFDAETDKYLRTIKTITRRTDTLSMSIGDNNSLIRGRDMDNNGVLEGDEIMTEKYKNNPEENYDARKEWQGKDGKSWKWGPQERKSL